ncbi:hypothetical protein [Polaribacter aestuariivivens]|uniref:hypothetical protein n=1 Tax=Polaribacter aestuariivivens TaxID=2304626 RepID=UPI003F49566B
MKTLVFQITKQKAIDFSFLTHQQMLKYPVYEHYLREVEQSLVVYQYKAGAKFSEEEYIQLLQRKLKRKYNAYSVIYLGSKIEEITLNK